MHPRKASLPLLFLFTFAAIFVYSYHYHSSVQLPLPGNPIRLSDPSRNPSHIQDPFSFTIKVLTFDRIESLRRCLQSLVTADYGSDRVNLHVFVDHFPSIDATNGSDVLVNGKLEESRQILDLVDGLEWPHGEKLILYRTGNAGLQAQWLEAWWPASDDDFAFIVEDDLEVSPLFYKYLKALILKYYYDMSNYSPLIYGVSLQRPRFVAGKHGNKLQVDKEARLFLYQIVGTWGQLLFPKPWKEFRLWYDAHKAKGLKPILHGMVTTGWYKKMGERIWTPWFIKFIHAKGYYNIYTNFLHERALAISHRDAGVNYGRTAGPDSNLLDEKSLDFNIWEMQPLKILKWYDFCFREVLLWRFVRCYDELSSVLSSMQKQKPVIIVSLYKISNRMAKNFLCHLEKRSIRNVIFIGGKLELIRELSERGYAVIDSEKLINSIGSYKSSRYDPSRTDLIREIFAKSMVVKSSIELGYDSWVIDGNFIPLSYSFTELPDPSCHFFVAKDHDMMFVRKSGVSSKIWDDDFISRLISAAGSSTHGDLLYAKNAHFAYLAGKTLEDSGIAEVCTFGSMFGVKLGTDSLNKASVNDSQMIFWPGNLSEDSIQRGLKNMEMWLIDDDLSCVSVVCHQQ